MDLDLRIQFGLGVERTRAGSAATYERTSCVCGRLGRISSDTEDFNL